MSATAKVDPDQEENTLRVTVDGVSLDNIQHFICKWISGTRLNCSANSPTSKIFVVWLFSIACLIWVSAEEKLQYRGVEAVSLASDVNVKYRKVILERFKDHQLTLLLATDLVARGIDIEHLECVINYDIPRDVEPIPTVPVEQDEWGVRAM